MKRKSKNQSKNKTLNFLRYLGPGLLAVSYTHLTLPTNSLV